MQKNGKGKEFGFYNTNGAAHSLDNVLLDKGCGIGQLDAVPGPSVTLKKAEAGTMLRVAPEPRPLGRAPGRSPE